MAQEAEQEIRRQIAQRGRITFAEFMELGLFWPWGGYYSSPDRIGPEGDFYTAPGAHPAFGALLCLQLFQMWQLLDRPSPFYVVEVGAGSGLLCHDVVGYSLHLPPGFRASLRYLCLDRWPQRGHEVGLKGEAASRVQRLAAGSLPLQGIIGCLLSNEVVDSFPVHRIAVQGGELKEVYITLHGGDLVEVLGEPSTSRLQERLEELGLSLPEGYRTEVNLALEPWLEEVASALARGFVVTLDYGYPAQELYSPRRSRGTLTCFYRHTQTDNPYRRIGQQDITAHVDFTSLINAGTRCGLEHLAFTTQEQFLRNLGMDGFMGRLGGLGLGQREAEANRLGMRELIRTGGMGDFRVLIQGKGVEKPALWGVEGGVDLEGLPVPLLTSRHMPLLAGRYPHLAFDWEELWPFKEEPS